MAIRDGEIRSAKLARSALKYTGAVRLNMPARGSIAGMRVVPQATSARAAAAPGMAQLRIRAVGLNFRDVLNVMGLYPGDPGPPGADCGGTVISLGDNIPHLRLAEDVFGESPGCLSTYNTSSAALLSPKPPSWTYEEARSHVIEPSFSEEDITVLTGVLYAGDLRNRGGGIGRCCEAEAGRASPHPRGGGWCGPGSHPVPSLGCRYHCSDCCYHSE